MFPPYFFLAETLYTFSKSSLSSTNLVKFHLSSQKSKTLHCCGLLSFSYKSTEDLFAMALKCDEKLKENLTCSFKYDMRSLVNFHPSTQTSKNFTSMGYFCLKYVRFELKKYRGVVFHGSERWCKIWINLDLVVSIMAWGIGWTFIRAPKNLKNCTLVWVLFVQSM